MITGQRETDMPHAWSLPFFLVTSLDFFAIFPQLRPDSISASLLAPPLPPL